MTTPNASWQDALNALLLPISPTGLPDMGELCQAIYKAKKERYALLAPPTQLTPAISGPASLVSPSLPAEDIPFLNIKGELLEEPLRLSIPEHPNSPAYARIQLTVKQGKSAQILAEIGPQTHPLLTVWEIELEENAQLALSILNAPQGDAKAAPVWHHLTCQQAANSTLALGSYALLAGTTHTLVRNTLHGPHASFDLHGIALTGKEQLASLTSYVEHRATDCPSLQTYKTIAASNGWNAFEGLVHVAKGANATNAQQRNQNIILHPAGRADARPNLIIDADDVKCGHGATTGRLDQERAFYLQSRGLTKGQAETLLLQAFVDEPLALEPIQPLADFLRERIPGLINTAINQA